MQTSLNSKNGRIANAVDKNEKDKNVVFKVFCNGGNYYVYDRDRHKIIIILKEEYESLNQTGHPELREAVIEKYQHSGFLLENKLEEVFHPMTEYVDEYLESYMEELILQVTQKCNLRCEYCFYGENNYNNRTHTYLDMSFETAKKAIDYFLQHSFDTEKSAIAFYGGEPLIKFDLIKECVSYVKERTKGKNMTFLITTNATLLTDEIIEFLLDNQFSILISLDGTRETHDMHRKFVNGKGSFDVVMKNVRHMIEKYPGCASQISFNTVLSPEMDVQRVTEFYSADEILKDSTIMGNTISDFYKDEPIYYKDKYFLEEKYGEFQVLLSLLGRIRKEDISVLFKSQRNSITKLRRALTNYFIIPKKYHHGGPCTAGGKRLFVNIRGEYFPCERVSESSEYVKIGNVDDGVDNGIVKELLNIGKYTKNECKNCWALVDCKICVGAVDDLKGVDKNLKAVRCSNERLRLLSQLKDICTLNDLGGAR